jgi:hypothetical protein
MGSTRGSGLMVAGAVLLVLSVVVFGYSRFVVWQHAVSVQSVAPPDESLPARIELPTPGRSASP